MTSVVERTVFLPAGVPLHARPAGVLVQAASRYDATITIVAAGKQANAKSILELLALGATGGSSLVISATGTEALSAAEGVVDVITALSATHKET